MTAKEILIKARALIEAPERWTQDVQAKDASGMVVAASSTEAVRWCALGALWRSAERPAMAIEQLQKAVRGSVGMFNDTHTHAEVLAAFDKAIASLP